jgi:hypothetical protein
VHHLLTTPAGPVELTCSVDGHEALTLTGTRALPRGVVETWGCADRLEVTLVVAHIDPPLSEDWPPLDGYVGAVWSMRARRPCGALTLGARLTAADAPARSGYDGSDQLAAVTHRRDGLVLSVGTHDDDALGRRASRSEHSWGPPLPAEWTTDLPALWSVAGRGGFGVAAEGAGLSWHLPALPAGAQADIHVAVGWGPDRDDAATWYAVDTEPGRVLTEALRIP